MRELPSQLGIEVSGFEKERKYMEWVLTFCDALFFKASADFIVGVSREAGKLSRAFNSHRGMVRQNWILRLISQLWVERLRSQEKWENIMNPIFCTGFLLGAFSSLQGVAAKKLKGKWSYQHSLYVGENKNCGSGPAEVNVLW